MLKSGNVILKVLGVVVDHIKGLSMAGSSISLIGLLKPI